MRFAICNELFEGWSFDRVCSFARGLGYEGLELAPFTLAPLITDVTPQQRATMRDQAADAGLEIIGLHWLLAKTEGLHLTSPDASVRDHTATYLQHLVDACADLGGHILVFGSPKQRSLLPGVTRADAKVYAGSVFRQVLPRAQSRDVTICMEPLAPADTDFVTTCAEGLELVRFVDHPNFRLHLDVKAMSSEATPVPALICQYTPHAGHFHANDANLCGPGFGDTDFVPIFRALRDAAYNQWVSVEVFDYKPDPETVAQKSIEYLYRCLPPRM